MTNKLVNGDYVKIDGTNDLEQIDYIDEVEQAVMLALKGRRGEFYPNKDFGSLIHKIDSQPVEEYALQYARQAVDTIDGVCIKSARLEEDNLIFDISINDNERQVSIGFENNI